MSNQATRVEDDFQDFNSGGKSASVFVKPKYLKVGDIIQATLDVIRDEVGKFKKSVVFMTLTAPLTYSDNKNAEKTYEAGEAIGINEAGNLLSALDRNNIQSGEEVRIRYEGMEPMKKGEFAGTPSHTFSLAPKKNRGTTTAPAALPE